jgi:hypothetical protein
MRTWQVAVAESRARERARTDRLVADLQAAALEHHVATNVAAGLLTDSTTAAADSPRGGRQTPNTNP